MTSAVVANSNGDLLRPGIERELRTPRYGGRAAVPERTMNTRMNTLRFAKRFW